MPIYYCELTQTPCTNPHTGEPIADITGRDNRCVCAEDLGHGCQCFTGGGKAGYPDVPITAYLEQTEKAYVLCRAEIAPTGGVEKTPAEARALLVADFGWPEESYVDGDVVRAPDYVEAGISFMVL